MAAYIIRRLLMGLLIIWGVYTITFIAVDLAPGDPFTAKENAKVTEEDLERMRAQWGYDLTPVERYFRHIRNMFYADPEVLEFEGGGIAFAVRAGSGTNGLVRASVQAPPAEIVLKPVKESVTDYGAETVRLRRAADGTYPTAPMTQGRYRFGLRTLRAFASDYELNSQGVRLRYDSETRSISAEDAFRTPPPSIQLTPPQKGGDPVVLKRLPSGDYESTELGSGRYVYEAGGVDLLVPEEPLESGGITFSLGTSIQHRKSVVEYLKPKFWATLKLGFWALLVNYLVGITLGVVSAVRKNTAFDHTTMVGAFFLYSMPGFWLALMLQLVFAVILGWLPLHGMGDGTLWGSFKAYAMPVFVLGVASAAGTARYQRSAVLEVMGEDYVRTARAKGLEPKVVVRKHVLRNALLPIITLFGLSMPFLVSGAVITEQIFSWPGIGRAAIDAITSRDVFVVTAVTLAATVMVVVGNLLADILYAVADPRVRLQ